ncbi:MAG TPA: STAS domain-containing protein [Bryobacteraceae bacterium]|nr:STAS domain-containing protein [Bryobacteraceae bacterium]
MITETNTRRVEPDITVLTITGRLSLGNILMGVENAIKRLIEGGVRKLILDVAGLDFIDSAGIGMLVSCAGQMEHEGGKVRIAGARGRVKQSFDTVHIHRITPIDPDVETACREMGSGGSGE